MSDQSKIQDSKSKTAFVFPGQGSQAVGMGRDLADNFPIARRTFEEADDALGFKLSEMCFAGTKEDLALTENTQPAILTVSIAAFRAIESKGFAAPDFVAGHSLGEYSALVAAEALSFADAVKIVRQRGQFMQEAVPIGVGGMAAVIGGDLATIEAACSEAAETEVCSAANINSPAQTVIAGHAAAVDRALAILKSRGVKRAIKLNVSAPFHSKLMQPAQTRLAEVLRETKFSDLRFPCVTNVEAAPNSSGERARALLIEQTTAPVRWLQTVEFLSENGVQKYVELGPGKVLSGLIRQIDSIANCANVEDSESLQSAKVALDAGNL